MSRGTLYGIFSMAINETLWHELHTLRAKNLVRCALAECLRAMGFWGDTFSVPATVDLVRADFKEPRSYYPRGEYSPTAYSQCAGT